MSNTATIRGFGALVAALLLHGCGQDTPESAVSDDSAASAVQVESVVISAAETNKQPVTVTNVPAAVTNASNAVTNTVAKLVPPKKGPPKGGDVILAVNEREVTLDEYRKYVDFLVALYSNKNPKADDKAKSVMRAKIKQSVHRTLTQRLAIRTKTDFSQVQEMSGVRERLQKDYVRSFGARNQSFEELLTAMREKGVEQPFLDDFELDVKLNSYLETTYAEQLSVTPEQLEQVKKDVAEYNENAQKVNAETEALGAELVKRLRSGEDFAKLADEFSKDPDKEPGGGIGECVESDFQDQPLYWRTLLKIKPGAVSDLIETNDGYEIVKVNRIFSPDDSSYGETSLDLARIFLRRAYEFPEQTEEEFKADVVKEKREAVLKNYIVGIVKQSKIVFPFGKAALVK